MSDSGHCLAEKYFVRFKIDIASIEYRKLYFYLILIFQNYSSNLQIFKKNGYREITQQKLIYLNRRMAFYVITQEMLFRNFKDVVRQPNTDFPLNLFFLCEQ